MDFCMVYKHGNHVTSLPESTVKNEIRLWPWLRFAYLLFRQAI